MFSDFPLSLSDGHSELAYLHGRKLHGSSGNKLAAGLRRAEVLARNGHGCTFGITKILHAEWSHSVEVKVMSIVIHARNVSKQYILALYQCMDLDASISLPKKFDIMS